MRSTLIDHAATQAAMQSWVQMECLQLSPGKRLGRLDSIDDGRRRVVREYQEAAVQKTGATPANFCTLSFCTIDPNFRFSEHGSINADTIFFLPERTEFDLFVPAGVQTTYVSFDQQDFLNVARVLNPTEWETFPRGVRSLHCKKKAFFQDAVEACFKAAKAVEMAMEFKKDFDVAVIIRNLLHQAISQIVTTTRDNALGAPVAARFRAIRIYRQARAFIEDAMERDELPTIAGICAQVGVCERTLQYVFRAHVGMSPSVYLRLLRLNRVRGALMNASPNETTVTTTAMRHGFLHLGRFARDYKLVFDETPSRTLAS